MCAVEPPPISNVPCFPLVELLHKGHMTGADGQIQMGHVAWFSFMFLNYS